MINWKASHQTGKARVTTIQTQTFSIFHVDELKCLRVAASINRLCLTAYNTSSNSMMRRNTQATTIWTYTSITILGVRYYFVFFFTAEWSVDANIEEKRIKCGKHTPHPCDCGCRWVFASPFTFVKLSQHWINIYPQALFCVQCSISHSRVQHDLFPIRFLSFRIYLFYWYVWMCTNVVYIFIFVVPFLTKFVFLLLLSFMLAQRKIVDVDWWQRQHSNQRD